MQKALTWKRDLPNHPANVLGLRSLFQILSSQADYQREVSNRKKFQSICESAICWEKNEIAFKREHVLKPSSLTVK